MDQAHVAQILVKGRACGVRLKDGTEIRAKEVGRVPEGTPKT
jgi:hypothetical protein